MGSRYRFYSTRACIDPPKKTTLLDPWFVTGFSDGESNFQVSITIRPESKLKCRVKIKFQIFLSIKEMPLLLEIKEFFGGVGRVNTASNNRASYVVDKPSDILKVIIPHFRAYPLITQKRRDFILWSRIADMIGRKEHLTIKGLALILKMKPLINMNALSEKVQDLLKESLDLYTEFEKVSVDTSDLAFKITSIPSPSWIGGFVACAPQRRIIFSFAI